MVTWRDDKVGDYATDHYSELELVMQKGGRMQRGESAISARGKPKPLKPRPKPLERSKPKLTKQQLESMSVSELESIKNQLQQSKGKPTRQQPPSYDTSETRGMTVTVEFGPSIQAWLDSDALVQVTDDKSFNMASIIAFLHPDVGWINPDDSNCDNDDTSGPCYVSNVFIQEINNMSCGVTNCSGVYAADSADVPINYSTLYYRIKETNGDGTWFNTSHLDSKGYCELDNPLDTTFVVGIPVVFCTDPDATNYYGLECSTCCTNIPEDYLNVFTTGIIQCQYDCSSDIYDCMGECDGPAVLDECGICDGPGPMEDCGCEDIPEGECDCDGNVLDECDVCGGNGSTCADCVGTPNGDAYFDDYCDGIPEDCTGNCAQCIGGESGAEACVQDCFSKWGGSAVEDVCGICNGVETIPENCCETSHNDCDHKCGYMQQFVNFWTCVTDEVLQMKTTHHPNCTDCDTHSICFNAILDCRGGYGSKDAFNECIEGFLEKSIKCITDKLHEGANEMFQQEVQSWGCTDTDYCDWWTEVPSNTFACPSPWNANGGTGDICCGGYYQSSPGGTMYPCSSIICPGLCEGLSSGGSDPWSTIGCVNEDGYSGVVYPGDACILWNQEDGGCTQCNYCDECCPECGHCGCNTNCDGCYCCYGDCAEPSCALVSYVEAIGASCLPDSCCDIAAGCSCNCDDPSLSYCLPIGPIGFWLNHELDIDDPGWNQGREINIGMMSLDVDIASNIEVHFNYEDFTAFILIQIPEVRADLMINIFNVDVCWPDSYFSGKDLNILIKLNAEGGLEPMGGIDGDGCVPAEDWSGDTEICTGFTGDMEVDIGGSLLENWILEPFINWQIFDEDVDDIINKRTYSIIYWQLKGNNWLSMFTDSREHNPYWETINMMKVFTHSTGQYQSSWWGSEHTTGCSEGYDECGVCGGDESDPANCLPDSCGVYGGSAPSWATCCDGMGVTEDSADCLGAVQYGAPDCINWICSCNGTVDCCSVCDGDNETCPYVQDCVDPSCCPESWIGDGLCDGEDQQWGCNLLCYDDDGGDCDPLCESGYEDDPFYYDCYGPQYDCASYTEMWCGNYDNCPENECPNCAMEACCICGGGVTGCPLGDSNGDGGINVLDVLNLVDLVLNPTGEIPCWADINSDGGLNVLDVIGLVQMILGGRTSDTPDIYLPPKGMSWEEQDRILNNILSVGNDLNQITSILDREVSPHIINGGRIKPTQNNNEK